MSRKSYAAIRKIFSRQKKNKANTKKVIKLIFKWFKNDLDAGALNYALYRCGFGHYATWYLMKEMIEEGSVLFVGMKPEKVNGVLVGYTPVYGFIDWRNCDER